MKNNHSCSYNFKISQSNFYLKIYAHIKFKDFFTCIIFILLILLIFHQNVDCSDLTCKKPQKNQQDSVQKSKEINSEEFPNEISISYPNKKQTTIWINPLFKENKSIPELDDFILVTQEPGVDLNELQNNIIYPANARKAKIQGRVLLRVLIDTNGDLQKVICEMTDSNLLTKAALDAVLKTKFTPAINDEKAVICWVSVPVNFKLK
jgi:protein TonB